MNDILFGNNNKAVIKKLAKADLKAHKLKTFLSGTIILIATCLMAVVFTVLVNDAFSQANSAPYHVMYRAVDDETKDILLKDSDFEAVGIYKSFGGMADDNGRTNVAFMDPSAMEFMGYQLIDGYFPQQANEVAVSKTYLDIYHLSIGDTFSFAYTDTLTNQQQQQQFTVCGTIENQKQEDGKQYYVLTSDLFRLAYAEKHGDIATSDFSTQTPASMDVAARLNAENGGMGAETQKEYLITKGLGLGIENYNIVLNNMYIDGFHLDTTVIIGVVLFVVFLMFASSFVIYSIFYISVVSSIPMYAQIMSLGTTGKQLRRFFKMQGNILALRFIPPGMFIALLIALLISGTKWITYDILITLCSGLAIFIVIKMALRKPTKLLTSISLIEAMKYTGASDQKVHKLLKRITPDTLAKNNLSLNYKKNRMSVISLSISGTLMIAIAILIASINLPAMLLQSYPLNEAFQIGIQMDNFYERFPQIIRANPLSDELIDEIYGIPGVEKVIKDESALGRLIFPEMEYESPNDNIESIDSLSSELLANVSEVVSGSVEYNEVGTDGIIMNKYRTDRSDLNYDEIKVGDTILFQFDVNGVLMEKEFQVMGIAYFPSTGLFYTTPEVINSIFPFNNTMHLSILCDDGSEEAVAKEVQDIISRNPNLTLKVYSEESQMMKSFIGVTMNSLYGVSAFVIVFGLLNMINTLINNAIIRKREFALLQAVGMTNKQLRNMLYREGMNISVKSAAIASVLGVCAGWLLCYLANEVMAFKFIIFQVSAWPILIFSVALIGLQMMVSYFICKTIVLKFAPPTSD